jgi:hypothetical protein
MSQVRVRYVSKILCPNANPQVKLPSLHKRKSKILRNPNVLFGTKVIGGDLLLI